MLILKAGFGKGVLNFLPEERDRPNNYGVWKGVEHPFQMNYIFLFLKYKMTDINKDGEYTECYKNGNIEKTYNVKNNKISGVVRRYYESGKLKSYAIYENNRANGIWIDLYESGRIAMVFHYTNNKINGLTEKFYESGNIKAKYFHINNSCEGAWLEFAENSTITAISEYKNGKLNGKNINAYLEGESMN